MNIYVVNVASTTRNFRYVVCAPSSYIAIQTTAEFFAMADLKSNEKENLRVDVEYVCSEKYFRRKEN